MTAANKATATPTWIGTATAQYFWGKYVSPKECKKLSGITAHTKYRANAE
jgi:hypothetical protein